MPVERVFIVFHKGKDEEETDVEGKRK